MEQSTAKGAGFLKVTGILMIIGGAIGIIFSIIALLGIAALATLADAHYELGMLYAAGAVALVGSACCRYYRRCELQKAGEGNDLHSIWRYRCCVQCSRCYIECSRRRQLQFCFTDYWSDTSCIVCYRCRLEQKGSVIAAQPNLKNMKYKA